MAFCVRSLSSGPSQLREKSRSRPHRLGFAVMKTARARSAHLYLAYAPPLGLFHRTAANFRTAASTKSDRWRSQSSVFLDVTGQLFWTVDPSCSLASMRHALCARAECLYMWPKAPRIRATKSRLRTPTTTDDAGRDSRSDPRSTITCRYRMSRQGPGRGAHCSFWRHCSMESLRRSSSFGTLRFDTAGTLSNADSLC